MNLHTLISHFIDAQRGFLEDSTVKWYEAYLTPLDSEFGQKNVENITTSDLRALFRTISTGITPYTRMNYIRAWKRLFKWAVSEDLVAHNPAALLKRPPLPEKSPAGISDHDVTRLLNAARQSSKPERDTAILHFLLESGARLGGVAGLTLPDLDLDSRRAIVREKGRGGQKERVVFFGTQAQIALRRWLSVRPETSDARVFLLKPNGIYQVIKRLANKAGVTEHWNPHAFRHHFARHLLQRGVSVGVVSHLMGHSNVQVTIAFYGRFANDELQQIYDEAWEK